MMIGKVHLPLAVARLPVEPVVDRADVRARVRAYEAASLNRRVLGLYSGFGEPCPLRLRLNTYRGCSFACRHCYVWDRPGTPLVRPDRRILVQLERDIREYPADVEKLPVMLSCSTDPMNTLEPAHRVSLRAIQRLGAANFPIIIMTQNPAQLLEPEYLDAVKACTSLIEVTVQSMQAGLGGSGIFRSQAPPARERLEAMGALAAQGLTVRLRLDPLVPRWNADGPGQSREDVYRVVAAAAHAGATLVVSKCMRLAPDVPLSMRVLMQEYYEAHAFFSAGEMLDLRRDVQEELMGAVRDACSSASIAFCTCTSLASDSGALHCSTGGWGALAGEKENQPGESRWKRST
jgi:DNA repair photolyase